MQQKLTRFVAIGHMAVAGQEPDRQRYCDDTRRAIRSIRKWSLFLQPTGRGLYFPDDIYIPQVAEKSFPWKMDVIRDYLH
jgi:hypothetical protein